MRCTHCDRNIIRRSALSCVHIIDSLCSHRRVRRTPTLTQDCLAQVASNPRRAHLLHSTSILQRHRRVSTRASTASATDALRWLEAEAWTMKCHATGRLRDGASYFIRLAIVAYQQSHQGAVRAYLRLEGVLVLAQHPSSCPLACHTVSASQYLTIHCPSSDSCVQHTS